MEMEIYLKEARKRRNEVVELKKKLGDKMGELSRWETI